MGAFTWVDKVWERLGVDSWQRAGYDFRLYGTLRRHGLDHAGAMRELDRLWAAEHPHLTEHGYPR